MSTNLLARFPEESSSQYFCYLFTPTYGMKKTVKGKAVPLQTWRGPEGSRKLRLPDFVTTVQDGGSLSALRTGRFYPPGNAPGSHFC